MVSFTSGVDSTTSSTATSTTSSTSTSSTSDSSMLSMVNGDDFLTLFIAQLQNQDPLSPMDSTGFTEQIATYTSVQQLMEMNSSLTQITASQAGMSANMIGMNITWDNTSGTGDATLSGTVTGVSFDDGTTSLTTSDGATVNLGDVTSITANS